MSRRDKTKQRAPDKSLPGYCNICNQFGKLTLDHVPPKGSVQLRASETAYFLHALQGSAQGRVTICGDERLLPPRGGRRRSQNGVKFRTICATCNNARLGAKYDPELKRVANVIGQLARAQAEADLRLPPSLRVSVRTHYLIRGIIGHLLAAVEPRDRSKPRSGFDAGFHRHLREYFLDESIPLPKTVRVYYWLYPTQDRQVIINGLALQLKDGAATFIVGSLIKFFPVAYYIVNTDAVSPLELGVPWIEGGGCNDLACQVDLCLRPASIPPLDWPEVPGLAHHTVMPLELAMVSRTPRGSDHRARERKQQAGAEPTAGEHGVSRGVGPPTCT